MSFRSFITNIGNYIAYLVVRLFVCLLQAVSIETCQRFARGLAWLVTDVIPLRRNVVDDNLRHAFPEMSPANRRCMARDMWEHLFVMLAENRAFSPQSARHEFARLHSLQKRIANDARIVSEPAAGVCLRPLRQFRTGRIHAWSIRLPYVHGRAAAR